MDNALDKLKVLGQNGPEVSPGAWTYSASQLRTFHDCARKWYFQKILKYPTPSSPAADLGKSLHKQVEDYIQDGTEPTDERAWLLLRNLGNVDLTREDITVEGKVQFLVEPGNMPGPRFLGYIDLVIPGQGALRIVDHKTTGNLKWAKSEYELHGDIQMIAYAHWAFMQLPDLQEIEVVHNYVQTKGAPETRVVIATLTRSEVAERWAQDHLVLIEKMERTRAIADVRKVPVNLKSCGKFGGCPHSEVCARAQFGQEIQMFNPPDATAPDGRKEEVTMNPDIKARLEALRAKASGGAPAPEPAPKMETVEGVDRSEGMTAGGATKAAAALLVPGQSVLPPSVEKALKDSVDKAKAARELATETGTMHADTSPPAPEPEMCAQLINYGFGARARRALKALAVESIEDLLALDANKALEVPTCGQKVVEEIEVAQANWGKGEDGSSPLDDEPVPAEPKVENEREASDAAALDSALGSSPVPSPELQPMTITPEHAAALSPAEEASVGLEHLREMADSLGIKITIEIGG